MKIIETARLILRTWQDADLEPMLAINQDPRVMEYFPALGDRESTKLLMENIRQHHEEHGFSLYAVELKETQEFIGFVGLAFPSFDAHFMPAVEIGWRLAFAHWSKGYATEAAKAVLHYAFTKLNLEEVVSFTVSSNFRSRQLMKRIGLHHNPQDDFDHPKLADDSLLKRHILYRLSKTEYIA